MAQLRNQLIAILGSSFDSPDLEGMIREAVALADKIRTGIDINGDEHIEPISGEGGAITAYEHAYYMAAMVIFLCTNETSTHQPKSSFKLFPPSIAFGISLSLYTSHVSVWMTFCLGASSTRGPRLSSSTARKLAYTSELHP